MDACAASFEHRTTLLEVAAPSPSFCNSSASWLLMHLAAAMLAAGPAQYPPRSSRSATSGSCIAKLHLRPGSSVSSSPSSGIAFSISSGLLAQLPLVVGVALHGQGQRLRAGPRCALIASCSWPYFTCSTISMTARSCLARRIASASPSSFSIAESRLLPSDLTSWHDLGGLLHQQLEAHQRQRLVQAVDDRADVQPGRGRPRQHGRVDRRLEQRRAGGRCPGCSGCCGS